MMKVLIQEKDGTRKPIDPKDIMVDGVSLDKVLSRLSTLEIAVPKNKESADGSIKALKEAVTGLAKDVDTIKAYLVKQGGLRK
jgi:hypothetical protein